MEGCAVQSQAGLGSRAIAAPAWSLRAAAICLFLSGLALLIPFASEAARSVLTAAMLAAMTLYLTLRARREPLNYAEVVIPFSVIYILSFGVASVILAYYPELLFRPSLQDYLTQAAGVATLGYFAFLAGYAVSFSRVRPSRLSGVIARGAMPVLLPAALGFGGFLARVSFARQIHATGTISAALSGLGQFAPVFFFGWFLAWYRVFRERTTKDVMALVQVLPLAALILVLTPGHKELTITILGFPLVAYWYSRRRVPVGALLTMLLVLIFVIFPVYNAYRWQDRELPSAVRMERTLHQVRQWDTATFLERSLLAFAGRVATITSTAAVLRDVPRWVDYKYGETLILAPVSVLIPRILWPDKPKVTIGREFATTFNLVNQSDKETQIASSWVGELYWNFQIPGVVFGMFLIGAAYRWVYVKFGDGTGDQPIRWAVYATMLTGLLHSEGDLAANVAGMVKLMLMLAVLIASLKWLKAIEEAPPGSARPGRGGAAR